MPIRLPTDDGPSEKDSFLPTTDVKRPSSPPAASSIPPAPPAARRVRKALVAVVGSLALALLALYTLASCDGPHHGAWGEVREGWGMVRHGRGSRWGDADRHGFDGLFDEHEHEHKIDWLGQSADLPSLALTAPAGSSNLAADITLAKGTQHVVVALGPDVYAEVALVQATTSAQEAIGVVTVEALEGEVEQDAVRVLSGELPKPDHDHHKHVHHSAHHEDKRLAGLAGVVIRDSGRYLITVAFPPAGVGRPIDLTLQGDQLALAGGALDLAGFRLGRFELASSTGEDAVVENLHAREGAIRLTSGAIKGSFNISGELVLTTLVGPIEANVSIFEVPHHDHHHKQKHNETASPLELDAMAVEARKEKPHHPPPHDGPHPHPPPHHRPEHLVKVLAKAGVGSVSLTFVDDRLPSNKTSLLAVAKAQVGDVVLSVLPGFKGVFAEGSRIGEVAFANPGGSKIVIDKEKHTGPGGFIKGFVGERPKHHHDDEHSKHPKEPKEPEHPKEPKEPKKLAEEDALEAELYPFRHDEEARLGRQRKQHAWPGNAGEADDRRPEKRHRKHSHSREEVEGGDEGKHPHHPPPCHRPHGPPPHHHAPPPGYGFAGAFAGTGKADIVFR